VKLGEMKCIAVASASYIKKYLPGRIKRDQIREAPALIFDRDDKLIATYLEKFYQLKMTEVQHHSIPSIEAFIAAAKHGMTLSVLPKSQAESALKTGELININKAHFISVPLYWHSWALDTVLGKAITSAIVHGAKKYLR